MDKCPICKKYVPENSPACPECGTLLAGGPDAIAVLAAAKNATRVRETYEHSRLCITSPPGILCLWIGIVISYIQCLAIVLFWFFVGVFKVDSGCSHVVDENRVLFTLGTLLALCMAVAQLLVFKMVLSQYKKNERAYIRGLNRKE